MSISSERLAFAPGVMEMLQCVKPFLEGGRPMESSTMGRVLTEVLVENLGDLFEVQRGLRPPDQVRRVSIRDALVDTGATTLSLPSRLIEQLGLSRRYEKRVTTST